MRNDVNRRLVLAARPHGMVKDSDFRLEEAPIPVPAEGEVLIRNLYLSFDPTQRGWMEDRPSYLPPVKIGEPMRAGAVGQVVESRNPDFKPGEIVQGTFGWVDYLATAGGGIMPVTKVPANVPLTAPVSIFGITGLTAYFGMLDIGKPAAGETVLVSGAAGAAGSVAGQLAKLKGATVIGTAGGPDKARWVKEVAGFDHALDYREGHLAERIKELAPKGINVFFDNVGGEVLEAGLANLALRARVVLCGGISSYNATEPPPGPRNYMQIVIQRARVEGFIVLDYAPRFPEAIAALGGWLAEGKIQSAIDVQEGLENAPATLRRLFEGKNLGKQILKIADPPLPRI